MNIKPDQSLSPDHTLNPVRSKPQLLTTSHVQIRTQLGDCIRVPLYQGETGNISVHLKSLHDVFEAGLKVSEHKPCFGYRISTKQKDGSILPSPYIWQTYAQIANRRSNFGSGLIHLHQTLPGHRKKYLGIYSINRPEWMIADLACHAYSFISVALYDTLGRETVEYVINHAEIEIIVTSIDKIDNLLTVAGKCPSLKVIVSMDDLIDDDQPSHSQVLKSWAQEKGLILLDMKQVEKIGKSNPSAFILPQSDDIAAICYTSGTTGQPKGAMLSHAGIIAVGRASQLSAVDVTSQDVHISYLPLAHVYERCIMTFMLMKGAKVGFFRGDGTVCSIHLISVALLVEDIKALQPTIFPSVPRLLNRIHDKISTEIHSSSLKSFLFTRAYKYKLSSMKANKSYHSIWDTLIFNKIQEVLGGKVRIIFSASAPVSPEVLEFIRVVFGCHVLEAYGQTEASGALSLTWPYDFEHGHVGPPLPCCEVKLVSVPEMKYLVTDHPNPRGEICVRGPIVFKGYHKDPESTKECLEDNGWLHTGDIGVIDHKGRICIIDRKKNIFKLSQGEYIAPDKIENCLQMSSFVSQIFVHGDSLRNDLVAIVVPDPEVSIPYAKEHGIIPSSVPNTTGPLQPGQDPESHFIDLCKSKEFKRVVMEDFTRISRSEGLKGFEFVKNVYFFPVPFSVENGLLTPTFKIKRVEARDYFKDQIAALYEELEDGTLYSGIKAKM